MNRETPEGIGRAGATRNTPALEEGRNQHSLPPASSIVPTRRQFIPTKIVPRAKYPKGSSCIYAMYADWTGSVQETPEGDSESPMSQLRDLNRGGFKHLEEDFRKKGVPGESKFWRSNYSSSENRRLSRLRTVMKALEERMAGNENSGKSEAEAKAEALAYFSTKGKSMSIIAANIAKEK